MHHLVEHGCSCSLPAVDVLLNKNRMQCTDNIRSSASTGRTWLSPDGFATKCVLLANIFCMRMLYMPLDCTIMIKVKLKGLYIYIYRTWFLFCFTSATETLVCMAAWSTHLYRATNDISALELFTLLSYLLQPQFLHYVVKLNPYIL